MSADKLYQILSDGQPKGIPWEKAAAQFVKLKMASGGLIPEQIEELHELAKQAAPTTISREELEQATKRGILSGTAGSVRGDIARASDVRRKRGENISKNVGTLVGALGGGAAGKRLIGGKGGAVAGAALGALLGHGTGKTVGQEIDRARIKSQGKKNASIEKQSGIMQPDQPRAKDVIPGRGPEAREARTALREKLRAGCPGQEKTSDFDKEAKIFGATTPDHVIYDPSLSQDVRELALKNYLAEKSQEAPSNLAASLAVPGGIGALLGGGLGAVGGWKGSLIGGLAGGGLGAGLGALARGGDIQEIARAKEELGNVGGALQQRALERMQEQSRRSSQPSFSLSIGGDDSDEDVVPIRPRRVPSSWSEEPLASPSKPILGKEPEDKPSMPGYMKYGEARVRSMLMAKKASLRKRAQEEEGAIPVEYLESMERPEEDEMLPPELEEFMQAQQQANEAEFFRQKAEEAETRASQAEEAADQAAAMANQAQQQADMQAQQSDMQAQATQQQADLAAQQSQMASQDAMNARNESLSAQQQNIQMRQAITTFRQQLMDLVSQDPTTMMPPPAVPQGPPPEMAGAAMPPEAGMMPPGAEGAPPGPPGAPPGAEGAAPPPGAEMAPPGPPAPPPGPPGAPPGMPPGPPAGPPAAPAMG